MQNKGAFLVFFFLLFFAEKEEQEGSSGRIEWDSRQFFFLVFILIYH
jgi:hypothetical protein